MTPRLPRLSIVTAGKKRYWPGIPNSRSCFSVNDVVSIWIRWMHDRCWLSPGGVQASGRVSQRIPWFQAASSTLASSVWSWLPPGSWPRGGLVIEVEKARVATVTLSGGTPVTVKSCTVFDVGLVAPESKVTFMPALTMYSLVVGLRDWTG